MQRTLALQLLWLPALIAPIACAALGCADGDAGSADAAETVALDDAMRDALLAALDDERKAEAFYIAIMAKLGDIRPFSNIVHAEQRHQELLLPLLKKYGVDAPANPYKNSDFEVPATRAEACALAAQAERDNIALYDRLMPTIKQADIRTAFTTLRDASAERHLPAFERCAGRTDAE